MRTCICRGFFIFLFLFYRKLTKSKIWITFAFWKYLVKRVAFAEENDQNTRTGIFHVHSQSMSRDLSQNYQGYFRQRHLYSCKGRFFNFIRVSVRIEQWEILTVNVIFHVFVTNNRQKKVFLIRGGIKLWRLYKANSRAIIWSNVLVAYLSAELKTPEYPRRYNTKVLTSVCLIHNCICVYLY